MKRFKEDEASIHVVEALLAGTIILTAMLFLTSASSPSPAAAESGLDLAIHASDNLVVLQEDLPDDDEAYTHRLEEIIDTVISTDQASGAAQAQAAADAEAQLAETVGTGNRYLLRLDNGYTQITLLPVEQGFRTEPRAAKAAERFHVPGWQDLAAGPCGAAPDPATTTIWWPGADEDQGGGDTFDVQAGDTLLGPMGDEYGPGDGSGAARTWTDWWLDQQGTAAEGDSGPDKIPFSGLYGWWQHDGVCKFIGLDEDTATDYPAYGVQLVVWPIAG